jgi:hypothetical protein
MAKKRTNWSKISAQDKARIWGNSWYGEQDFILSLKKNKRGSSWSSNEAKFLVQGFEVAQET